MKLEKRIHHNHCLICFNDIRFNSLFAFINRHKYICSSCLKLLEPEVKVMKLDKVKLVSFYKYDKIKTLIYQYKGLYDIELSKVFLDPYLLLLKILYKDYFIIPIPSSKKSDQERGFNHVYEIAKLLSNKIINCLEKNYDFKQSSLSKKERENMKNKYIINQDINLVFNKKILLFDDIITSGSTLKYCISLIEKYHPKKIACLTISYGEYKQ